MPNPIEQIIANLPADKRAVLAELLRPAPEPIAIVGMGCHFPGGATSPAAFWELLQQGADTISEVPAERWNIDEYYDPDPDVPGKTHTRWGGFVHDLALFDAQFFGISPKEALRMDPQHRLLLEVAWQALEHAGESVDALARSQTGVYIGIMPSTYNTLQIQIEGEEINDDPYIASGNMASMATGRLSYLFDLQGPNVAIDTACSSSLVATHLACHSLRTQECNLALVGGVNAIVLPDTLVKGTKLRMMAADGRCKTFDAAADGYVVGEGCGILVLKRLSDAIKDGNTIMAVIRGSAVNEDGRSSSPTAPNGLAQQAVIRKALQEGGVQPQQVSYIEAHGSGTPLGDPIELESLGAVFGNSATRSQPLLVSTVKTNIGHLYAAAGVAGLIKTVLAMQNQAIPPHLNLQHPTPGIAWNEYPFVIPQALTPWRSDHAPRIAGVNSFGWSGTNGHVLLEEAPVPMVAPAARPQQLLVISAKTASALDAATDNLVAYLRQQPDVNLADVAYTLQLGRSTFTHRRSVVVRDVADAIAALTSRDPQRVLTSEQTGRDRPVALLLGGVGDQYVGLGRALYDNEPAFRATVDTCCQQLTPLLGHDLRALLWPNAEPASAEPTPAFDLRALLGRTGDTPAVTGPLAQPAVGQAAVFVVEYALAQQLQAWGMEPQALLGYSLGELVAATLAGVLSLPDALRLVVTRARLMERLPAGALLTVALSATDITPLLPAGCAVAIVTGPRTCVVGGSPAAIASLTATLAAQEIACRPVATTQAVHTALMEPIAAELTAFVRTLALHPPQIPVISNVTGSWLTEAQATDPAYWAQHLCQPVQFDAALATLLERKDLVVVEIGAGAALSSFVKQHPTCDRIQAQRVIATLPAASEGTSALTTTLTALGRLWLAGAAVEWSALYTDHQRRRVPLPTYPFERQRFWPGALPLQLSTDTARSSRAKKPNIADWFYLPHWRQAPLIPTNGATVSGPWLIFSAGEAVSAGLIQRLEQTGSSVIQVQLGTGFAQHGATQFSIRPDVAEDYKRLIRELADANQLPRSIVHAWNVAVADEPMTPALFEAWQSIGFRSLVCLAQALSDYDLDGQIGITVLSTGVQSVVGDEPIIPEKATILGPCKVIPQEYQHIVCRNIDLTLPVSDREQQELLDRLTGDLVAQPTDVVIAYRGNQRWVQSFQPLPLPAASAVPTLLRQGGVYLITGGLGNIGLRLAEYLARKVQARLVLIGRTAMPAREQWSNWLATHTDADPISYKLRALLRLEELGAEILLLQADVARVSDMQNVLEQTRRRFGSLHGVIHGAGTTAPDTFQAIQDIEQAQCDAHFQPKIYGLYAIEQALAEQPLDFCVLLSSLSSILGGLGFVAYTAANAFMDSVAHWHDRRQQGRWISVNWDVWQDSLSKDLAGGSGTTLAEYSMSPEEGVEVFERILGSPAAQIVNSTGDLDTRIRQWVLLESVKQAEPKPTTPAGLSASGSIASNGTYEQRIAAIWQQVLGQTEIGLNDNFFDLGGNSLIGIQAIAKLNREFKIQIPPVALFEAPTVTALAQYLQPKLPQRSSQHNDIISQRRQQARQTNAHGGIAIIGMAGRFPGAESIEQFWENLCNSVEALTTFSDEQLLAAHLPPELINDPDYVKARPILDDIAGFDATFFGYTPREAELMDPQQRLFHECAWEALETAGYDSLRYPGLVGVFAGASISTYMLQILSDPRFSGLVQDAGFHFLNDKDSLATNVSYKLNLRGPSFSVQTFCSTSLVATHLACQSLRHGECDMALAGGVSVRVPVQSGHLYREGDQVSVDGHCRTFDAQAAGATFGDGVALVVLKRLEDALADGDTIHAVIRGSAINNDGALKVGYTAPSVVGQAEVVRQALADAQLSADSISYVEAHGTATPLGDPIEVAALTKAFRASTDRTQFCHISSVKPNVGHLDRAAGATGLIKTVLALRNEQLPATLHFQQPNPEIDFANSPFVVTTQRTPWPRTSQPRRAGVNSLGVGGTNAHVIVEEAPLVPPSAPGRPAQLLLLAARTPTALAAQRAQLAEHLAAQRTLDLADVAYTLQMGRRHFGQRLALVCHSREEALTLLRDTASLRVLPGAANDSPPPVALLLGGVGDHYVGLGRALYDNEPAFRATVDTCCQQLTPLLGHDLRALVWPDDTTPTAPITPSLDLRALLRRNGDTPTVTGPLAQPTLGQAAVFVVEYALAQQLQAWGMQPQALLGYSLGELVAGTLAGVLSLPDALRLVVTRARLMERLPAGALLTVALSAADVTPLLPAGCAVAIVTGPRTCVVGGSPAAIASLTATLAAQEIACRPVATTQAVHTALMEPIAAELTAFVRTLALHPPQIPVISNVTGSWLTETQATDPTYWAQHLCQPVQFDAAIATLLERKDLVLVEVGAGAALSSFVKQHPACDRIQAQRVIATLPTATESTSSLTTLLTALGRLWLAGVSIEWSALYTDQQRRRVPLPTYPFERQRFWIEPDPQRLLPQPSTFDLMSLKREDLADWFFLPSWKHSVPQMPDSASPALTHGGCWLVFQDQCGLSEQIIDWLIQHGQDVVRVKPGALFGRVAPGLYTVNPRRRADYDALLIELQDQGKQPGRVIHAWTLTDESTASVPDALQKELIDLGFYSLLCLAQALADLALDAVCQINILSNGLHNITGSEHLRPEKATVIGPCRLIPFEYTSLTCRSIDVTLPGASSRERRTLVDHLLGELLSDTSDQVVALRGNRRWVQTYEQMRLPEQPGKAVPLRKHGVYVITGGLGSIGLALAEHLARTQQARLVLVGRSALPARELWSALSASGDHSQEVARKIRAVQTLEAHGAEVLVLQADVAHVDQMRVVVQTALEHFGTIHGVFHAAGVPGVGLISLKTQEAATSVLAPKVQGTVAIAQAVRDLPLDFLVLFSAIASAVGGGAGQADYSAANAFMDAYAQAYSHEHGMTIAIGWGEWEWNAWEDVMAAYDADTQAFFRERRQRFGISFEEGFEALQRLMARGLPNVFVSTQDMRAVVDLMQHSNIAMLQQPDQRQQTFQARPAIGTSYVAPRTQLEETIAAVWSEQLGISDIGINDNFFDLGGNSLLGIDLLTRLRKRLKIGRIPAYVLYEAPSISAMAKLFEQPDEATTVVEESQDRGSKRRARQAHRKPTA